MSLSSFFVNFMIYLCPLATCILKPMFISFNRLLRMWKIVVLSLLLQVSFVVFFLSFFSGEKWDWGDNIVEWETNCSSFIRLVLVGHITCLFFHPLFNLEKRKKIEKKPFGFYPDRPFRNRATTLTRCVDCYFNFSFFLLFFALAFESLSFRMLLLSISLSLFFSLALSLSRSLALIAHTKV